jgi:hypothetical protein
MKSRDLQRVLWDWLGTAERLHRSLAEQTAALSLRNVARVEELQPELETLQSRLGEIDKQAVASTQVLAGQLGVIPTVRNIVEVLKPAEARQLDALSTRVRQVGENLHDRLGRNRKLIDNELNYVNGSLALIAKVANETRGQFDSNKVTGAILVDQVA